MKTAHAVILRAEGQRPPQLGAGRKGELRRHHPDHSCGLSIQDERAAEDCRIAPETALPQPVAQDDDSVFSLAFFLRRKCPAQCGLNAEHFEIPCGNHG